MTILENKVVKTRKDHLCQMCHRMIPKGSRMQRQVNTFDGIQSFYNCLTCEDLKDHMELLDGMWRNEHTNIYMSEYRFDGTPEEFLEFLENEEK